MDENAAITDRKLLVKSLVVLTGVLAAFVGARFIGLESGTIGMGGAALLLLLDNVGRPRSSRPKA
jgi:Na+/H+ antiporter NhaD/arsenite permease-like protein